MDKAEEMAFSRHIHKIALNTFVNAGQLFTPYTDAELTVLRAVKVAGMDAAREINGPTLENLASLGLDGPYTLLKPLVILKLLEDGKGHLNVLQGDIEDVEKKIEIAETSPHTEHAETHQAAREARAGYEKAKAAGVGRCEDHAAYKRRLARGKNNAEQLEREASHAQETHDISQTANREKLAQLKRDLPTAEDLTRAASDRNHPLPEDPAAKAKRTTANMLEQARYDEAYEEYLRQHREYEEDHDAYHDASKKRQATLTEPTPPEEVRAAVLIPEKVQTIKHGHWLQLQAAAKYPEFNPRE